MRPQYKIGDRVRYRDGITRFAGTITEDRGPLGTGGCRVYQVLVPITYSDPEFFEMREDEIGLVPAPAKKAASPAK
ncbi:MAG: hypothetical protein EXS16_07445 [Gemmataceae bacterium]|nr:hypothetical protein [Gemmataceae bacterium]